MDMGGISPWSLVLLLIVVLIPLLIFRPIAMKAGYSGWWALAMLIPIVNIILVWVFAIVDWPIEKE